MVLEPHLINSNKKILNKITKEASFFLKKDYIKAATKTPKGTDKIELLPKNITKKTKPGKITKKTQKQIQTSKSTEDILRDEEQMNKIMRTLVKNW